MSANEEYVERSSVLAYQPPNDMTKLASRLPLWVWKDYAGRAYLKDIQRMAPPSSASASDIAVSIAKRYAHMKATLETLCSESLENMSFKNSKLPAESFLLYRYMDHSNSYKKLKAIQAELAGDEGNAKLKERLLLEYSAWNPFIPVMELFMRLFGPKEARMLQWTAKLRWKTRNREVVLKEWKLMLENTDFVIRHDKACYQAALACLRSNMISIWHEKAYLERKEVLKRFEASEGAGAGAGAAAGSIPLEASLFNIVYQRIMDLEEAFDHAFKDSPLGEGWAECHEDVKYVLAMSNLSKPTYEIDNDFVFFLEPDM